MASTGLQVPASTGEDFTAWTTPTEAYTSNDAYAVGALDGNQQDYYDFSFSIPAGSTIDGIEARLEANDIVANAEILCEMSWNGGTNYTASGKTTGDMLTTDATYILGGATDTWGRTWTVDELSNTNFRFRVENNQLGANARSRLDLLQVDIFYTEAAGGSKRMLRGHGK